MTPAARVSAAIEVLDAILAGTPPEPALTNWGRAHRFAGSGDRGAIRDLVFTALRRRASLAVRGGSPGGRGLMLGLAREEGREAEIFTGAVHAPAPAASDETGAAPEGNEALDCPDWLAPRLMAALGPDFAPVMQALQHRAPVFLRVNLSRASPAEAANRLAAEGIATRPVELVNTALEVTENARKIQTSEAWLAGLVELQDASSQAVVASLEVPAGTRVLDHCAGGGGKTLALLDRGAQVFAHDAEPRRMADLPPRAARAGFRPVLTATPEATAPYDLILTDVPCSGSGSWRRDPMGKWSLTPARLAELTRIQSGILDRVVPMLAPGGRLAYATCSLLAEENEAQAAAFLQRHPDFRQLASRRFSPLSGGDGFFLACFARA